MPRKPRLRAAERDALKEELGQLVLKLMAQAERWGLTVEEVRTVVDETAVNWRRD